MASTPALYQNQTDASSYGVYGQAILDDGLCVQDGISGAGIITRGFLWPIYDIWLDTGISDPIVTAWSAAAGYSGCISASLVSTSWTSPSGGIWGEAPS